MPAFMKTNRSAAAQPRFCQSGSSEKSTWNSCQFLLTNVKTLFSQSRVGAAMSKTAIALPQISGKSNCTLDRSNQTKTCKRAISRNSCFVSLRTFLFLAMSSVLAAAQTTTTSLSLNPSSGANASAFTMTATAKSGGTLMTAGTVTFRDTYNGVTQTLGTVQVQSANGGATRATQFCSSSWADSARTSSALPTTERRPFHPAPRYLKLPRSPDSTRQQQVSH